MRTGRAVAATAAVLLMAACTAAEAGSAIPSGNPSTAGTTPQGSTSTSGPSAGVISFTTNRRGQVVLVRPDGSDKRELVAENGAPAALSPDGRQVMYSFIARDGTDSIAFVAADGDDRRPLKAPSGWRLIPGVWSPDARRVAVAREGDAAAHGGVYTVEPDGRGFRRLSDAGRSGYDFPLGWSGDGRWIAFMRVPPHDDDGAFTGRLYVVAADGRSRPWRVNPPGTKVRHFYVPPASFFPDSGRIAFVATRPQGGGGSTFGRVLIADLATHHVSTVTDWSPWTLTTDVSPDGQWLVFDKPSGVDVGDQSHRLFVVHPDGSDLHPVDASTPGSASAVWSPDGTALLAAIGATDDANNIGVIPFAGSAASDVVELTRTGGDTYIYYDWLPTPP